MGSGITLQCFSALLYRKCLRHCGSICDRGRDLVPVDTPARITWYEVEADTANDFMTYLASALGKLASVDSLPVTDQGTYLDRFAKAGVTEDRVVQQLQALRVRVLEKVLPIPSHAIEPSKIREFKNQHAPMLADFRRRVERELIEAANKSDDFLQQR